MLMIRLQRIGRKNQAAFRVLVVDSHQGPKSGKSIETLGSYSPHTNVFTVKKDRVLEWMSKGAQVSDTVHNLLVTNKIIEGKKINVLPRKAPIKKEGAEAETPIAPAAASVEASEPAAENAEEKVAAEAPSSDEKVSASA